MASDEGFSWKTWWRWSKIRTFRMHMSSNVAGIFISGDLFSPATMLVVVVTGELMMKKMREFWVICGWGKWVLWRVRKEVRWVWVLYREAEGSAYQVRVCHVGYYVEEIIRKMQFPAWHGGWWYMDEITTVPLVTRRHRKLARGRGSWVSRVRGGSVGVRRSDVFREVRG